MDTRIEQLKEFDKLYYTEGKSPVDDDTYDELKKLAREESPDDPYFSSVGADINHFYGKKVKHNSVMGSLSKSGNIEEFSEWVHSTYNGKTEFCIQPKIDGSSLSLVYKDGKLARAVSRGDGETGIDVTLNAVNVSGVKKEIDARGDVEVRGEVYKDKDDFYLNWVGEYANPRNFTAGSLNQKDPNVTKERKLSFVAYEIIGAGISNEGEKIAELGNLGFTTPLCTVVTLTSTELVELLKKEFLTDEYRQMHVYELDGIVVKLNNVESAEEMGIVSNRPKAHRAVKFITEKVVTKIVSIEYNVGRTGKITPVGNFEPVKLAGTTVKRATLNNFDFMRKLGITQGCEVELEKGGDIIPHVLRVVSGTNSEFVLPDSCPVCSQGVVWDSRGVTLHCKNDECPSRMSSSIVHWFDKIGVLGIGEGIVSRLLRLSLVGKISDMYNLKEQEGIVNMEFGNKAARNIFDAIESKKEVTLEVFIEALGIGQIGSMAAEIVKVAPTVEGIDNLSVSQIAAIHGFAEIKATNFVSGWKKSREEISELLKHIKIVQAKADSNNLAGKSFLFTGSFSSPKRGEMEKMVPANGGKLASSVSKNLDFLVWDGAIMKGKWEKANSLGVKIISQKEFMSMLNK